MTTLGYGWILTKIKGLVDFTAIAPNTAVDSDRVVCVVNDTESVACILGKNIKF